MMKLCEKRKGRFILFLGMILVLLGIGLFAQNKSEGYYAGKSSNQVLQKMQLTEMKTEETEPNFSENDIMPEIEIDGEQYIGQLTIPELKLELPIISQWSYPKLKVAPCRYSGTINQGNLVLLGHNYKSHFGRLHTLKSGARIEFKDINQNVQNYVVLSVETIDPSNVERVTSGDSALTLFTCTYGGQYRTMVKCDAVNPA